MKLQVDLDGEVFTLEFHTEDQSAMEYRMIGAFHGAGKATVEAVMPGVFSVLIGHKSFTVAVARNGSELELWSGGRRRVLALADSRDRNASAKKVSAAGPVEIRTQMPGRVIKLLVKPGTAVAAGQPVIIVEAMKMQNEMKSPKAGSVVKIHAAEGITVAAGETLLVIE